MKKVFVLSMVLFLQMSLKAQSAPTPVPAPTVLSTGSTAPKKPMHHDDHKMMKMSAADRAVEYSKQLKTDLSLNDDQYNQVLAINTECINRKDALKANNSDMRKGSDDIKAYRIGEFTKIFTSDQLATYQKMNKEGGMMSHRGHSAPNNQHSDKAKN